MFIPEKINPRIPHGPITSIGIDPSTTEAVFGPKNLHDLKVRSLAVKQPTEDDVVEDVNF